MRSRDPEELAIQHELTRVINKVLSTLITREEKILRLRYYGNLSYKECGEIFNLSKERIRQIEAKAIRRLRLPHRANKLKDFLYR